MVDVIMSKEISLLINEPLPICSGCVIQTSSCREAVVEVINDLDLAHCYCILLLCRCGVAIVNTGSSVIKWCSYG